MSEKQVRDYDKFMLRFPDGMRDAIAERAKSNGRSMNAEIIMILESVINDSVFSNPKNQYIGSPITITKGLAHDERHTSEPTQPENAPSKWIEPEYLNIILRRLDDIEKKINKKG